MDFFLTMTGLIKDYYMFRITKPRYLHYQNDQSHVRCDFVKGHSTMRFVAVATLFLYISLINNRFLVLFVLLFC